MIRRVRNNGGPVCECPEELAARLVSSGWDYADVEQTPAPAPKRRGRPKKADSEAEAE